MTNFALGAAGIALAVVLIWHARQLRRELEALDDELRIANAINALTEEQWAERFQEVED